MHIKNKEIKLTKHAKKQAENRGITFQEISSALFEVKWEQGQYERLMVKKTFPFNQTWVGSFYKQKEVKVIFKEEDGKIIVITAISRYFKD